MEMYKLKVGNAIQDQLVRFRDELAEERRTNVTTSLRERQLEAEIKRLDREFVQL